MLLIPATIISSPVTDDVSAGGLFALASLLIIPITFLPGALFLAFLEWLTGKTAGKALVGIRVIGVDDGDPIGLIRAAGRRAFIMIERYLLFIPSLVLIPFNRNFDGHLGDRLTGAIVARDRDIAEALPARSNNSFVHLAPEPPWLTYPSGVRIAHPKKAGRSLSQFRLFLSRQEVQKLTRTENDAPWYSPTPRNGMSLVTR